jgi:DNA primase
MANPEHRIPQDWLDDLLAKTDIVTLIDHRVPLKKAGMSYQSRCPFHSEKSPSFNVSPVRQTYHCFGCGAHGNAIGFLMEYDRMDFLDAVDWLAGQSGMERPRFAKPQAESHGVDTEALLAVQHAAMRVYQSSLKASQDAIGYLKGRGVTGDMAKTYALGFAPDAWRNLPDEWPMAHKVESGLMVEREGKHYDRFRGRVMFPIRNRKGDVIGFGGRLLGDGKPKYLNSPETPVFNKGREVYGLYELLQANSRPDEIIIVEGNLDVIALAQFGLTNTVATLGTAVGVEQVALLFRHAKRMVFCFDGDEAGFKAAVRALETSISECRAGRSVGFVILPEAEDPDSLVRAEGAEAFMARIAEAVPLSSFLFQALSAGVDLDTMEGRAALSANARPLIKQIPCPDLREQMAARLAEVVGLRNPAKSAKANPQWLMYGALG